jgi:hypothetical protein
LYIFAKGCNANSKLSKRDPDVSIDITGINQILEAEDTYDMMGREVASHKHKLEASHLSSLKETKVKTSVDRIKQIADRVRKEREEKQRMSGNA